jgi:chemotaxis protein methyltransferase CheR
VSAGAIATATGVEALSRAAGIDLSAYREEHVAEGIRRTIERERLVSVGDLVWLLRSDAYARERFRRVVGVSFSGLFRDPAQFDLLEHELLPPLLEANDRIRVWSAGCANGSELYSVAIVLERLRALEDSLLLGSDLLEENLAAARRGVYGDVAISERLRSRTRWERRDLVREPPPPGLWNLVLCRNVAIYLAPAAKRTLHEGLAGALAPGGVLLLGRSERLGDPRRLGLTRLASHAYGRTS